MEDRGPIGVGSRQIFRVEIAMDPYESMMVELPEDEIEPLPAGPVAGTPIDGQKVTEYLINGGLISILRSNLSGGRNQPHVWLRPDNLGNPTHTFTPDRGILGGQIVPFFAVRDDRIFTPKQDSVTSFVESFGLSHREAEDVVSAVGTAP